MASFRDRLNQRTGGTTTKSGSFRDRLKERVETEETDERSVTTGETTLRAIPRATTRVQGPQLPERITPTEPTVPTETRTILGSDVQVPSREFTTQATEQKKREAEEQKRLSKINKIKMDDIQTEIQQLTRKFKKTPEDIQKVKDLSTEFNRLQIEAKPGSLGFIEALPFVGTKFEKGLEATSGVQPETFEEAREKPGFKRGFIASKIFTSAAQYSAVNTALAGSKLGTTLANKLGSAFVADQAVDFLADRIVQAPDEWLPLLKGERNLSETAKNLAINSAVDVALNLAIGGSYEGLKKLRNTGDVDVVKQVDKTIQQELGLPEGTTAKEFLEQQAKEFEGIQPARPDPEVETFFKEFDKTPDEVFNDFQAWRSKNFGGATGRVSTDDMDTLKQLYKEDTGIDLDVALKEAGGGVTPLTKSQAEITAERIKETAPEFPTRTDKPFAAAPVETVPKKTFRQRLTESTEVKPEAPRVEPEVAKEVVPEVTPEPTVAREIVPEPSPRIPDIPTPEVGVSKSKFVERISEFLKGDPTVSKLKKEIDNLDKLPTTSDEARATVAKQVVRDDFEGALRMSMEGKQFGNRVESNVSLILADELQKQGRFAEQVELISKVSEKFRAVGEDLQSAKVWAKLSPEGMKKWAVDTLEKSGVEIDPKLIAEIGDDMKAINEMTPEQLAEMVSKRLGKVGESKFIQNQILNSFSFDQLKGTNTALTMQKVFDKIPIVKAKKLSSLQAMSHLLNFRTFTRNILGNTASIAAENINKIPASIADRGLKAFTGNRSVVASMPKLLQGMQEGWKQGKRSFFEITSGVSKGNQGKYDLLFGSAFKSKVGKGLEKAMGISLQSTDEFYKGFVKVDSLYNQLQARIGKEVKNWDFEKVMTEATEDEIKTALDEAKFVTFQNDSALAGILSKSKKFANEISEHIPGTVFTKDFGLGDLIVKYTRVPGNIITRGVEYSPVGYLKAVHDASKIITQGSAAPVAMQRQVAQALGRATTGSGLMAIGGFLRNQGIITGVDDTKDWDVNAFNNAEGVGNYRINIDALERLIKGENPEKQEGDTLKSYNWAAPMTTPIAIGARLAGEDANLFSIEGGKLLTAATLDEALDLPTLSIIKKMQFEGMRDASETGNKMLDIASVPIKEAIPSIVPSIVRQTAQAIDPTFRDVSAPSTLPVLPGIVGEKTASRIQANIPALPGIPKQFTSEGLPPRLDPLGREAQREGGPFGALVDPASTSVFRPTGFGDTLRKISELSDKTTVFPDRKPPNSFSHKGSVIQLTQEEKQLWQQTEGNYVNEKYSEFLKGKTVETEAEALKLAKVLETIKKRAGEKAKTEILKGRR